MRPVLRRWVRWGGGFLLLLLGLGALYVALLIYPSPLFAHEQRFGSYRVYSDEPIPADFQQTIDELDRRLRAMEHGPPEADQRIYLCGPGRFSFFAFLTRMNPDSLAIGLSVGNESFVSIERVRLFAARNQGRLRHTRFEGNLAEVVAHEIAHFNSVRALGYRVHLGQPVWKSEGWAEYQANLSAIRADPDYSLAVRIDRLLDESYWGGRHGMARRMWEAQLMVEYLGEVEGYRLDDLIQTDVTEASVRERMMAWYRSARDS